jgi:hypothetical protein
VYGSPHAWGAWLKEQGLRAAQLGGYDPLPWMTGWPTDPQYSQPVGAACTQPAECPSALCWAETCTRACNEAAPCPAGFLCEMPEGTGQSICVPEPPPDPPDDAEEGDDEAGATDGGDEAAASDGGGCGIASGDDPVTPVPWIVGAAAVGLALTSRRARARSRETPRA